MSFLLRSRYSFICKELVAICHFALCDMYCCALSCCGVSCTRLASCARTASYFIFAGNWNPLKLVSICVLHTNLTKFFFLLFSGWAFLWPTKMKECELNFASCTHTWLSFFLVGFWLGIFATHKPERMWTVLNISSPRKGQVYVFVLHLHCCNMWGSMEVSGTKNSTPTENFSVEVHFGGTWRAMSDQCWAVLGLCWAHVVPMLGPCWVIWWAMWGSMEVSGTNNSTQPKTFRLRLFLGALGGLCQTNVGPFWKTLLGRQSWKDSLRRRSWLVHCIN